MARKNSKRKADTSFEDYLKQHAFQGEVEFDLTFEMLGERVIRRARIVFAYTPEWEHLDPKSKTLREGAEMMSTYHIELHAEPDKGSLTKGGPYWINFQDLICDDVAGGSRGRPEPSTSLPQSGRTTTYTRRRSMRAGRAQESGLNT